MSTDVTTPPPRLDVSGTTGVPLTTLVTVELRKAVDTRAGRWYLIAILGLNLLVVLAVALLFAEEPGAQSYSGFLGFLGAVLGFFLPVVPILLVTSEWSQRTALVTFALEPRRPRVVMAKLIASVVMVAGVFVVAFVVAAIGVLLAGLRGIDADWSLTYGEVQGVVLANLIRVVVAFALAMLLLNSPAAIVAYFAYSLVVPGIFALLGFYVGWFGDLAPYIELNQAQSPLFEGDYLPDGVEWTRLATSALLWMVLPFTFGLLRLLRAEVK